MTSERAVEPQDEDAAKREAVRKTIVEWLGPQRMSLYLGKDIDHMVTGVIAHDAALAATPAPREDGWEHVAEPKVFYRCKRCGGELRRDGTLFIHEPPSPITPTTERDRVEQAFIDGSVEGSPIDRDGNRLEGRT